MTIAHPDEFFAAARAEYADAPVWRGELYLELHRATFTTQAKMKQGNRRSEHLLRAAELWATTAAVLADAPYPYDELDALWKAVLLHQFHDILPGSSIAWVHREARETYQRVELELAALVQASSDALTGAMGAEDVETLHVFNAGPRRRVEVVELPGPLADRLDAVSSAGPAEVQRLTDGRVAVCVDAPALGVGTTVGRDRMFGRRGAPRVRVDGLSMSNGLVDIVVDDRGLVASVYDVEADREVVAPGCLANLLQLHPDHPNAWDAWDIDRHYLHRHADLLDVESVEAVETGPMRATIRVVRVFGSGSRITQDIVLRVGSKRIDFVTEVDWRESERVLKAGFGLDVHAEHETAEIQFGHVQRPTHTNTSWDSARFELYAHRWVHVGEPGFGVALLTDSTYGHDVRRDSRDEGGTTTTLRLTLLRAPHSPDPHADVDTHRFTYSILPGASIADAIAEGYALNLPMRPVAASARSTREPVVVVDNEAVVVEAVKLADDRSGDVIVRLYESLGSRARASLSPAFLLDSAREVDLLERDLVELEIARGAIALEFRPFQIRTVRLHPAGR